MGQLDATIAVTAAAVLALGLVSARVQRLPTSRPLMALGLGVLAGPAALGWVRPEAWPDAHHLLREAARFALAVSVFGVALRTPAADLRRLARPVGVLLSLGLLAMWAVSAGLAWAMLGLSPLMALAVGAAVAPTDPVAASSIVTGAAAEDALPDRLRSTLSLESGANDGLGYAVVMLPVLLVVHPDGAWGRWAWDVLAVGVGLAVAGGAAMGLAAGVALRRADRAGWVEGHSLLGLSLALSALSVTAAKLMGSDGILAAFAAGLAFQLTVERDEEWREQEVQETIAKLLNLPVFVLLGAALPWAAWDAATLALAVAVVSLRRPLALALCGPVLGAGLRRRDAAHLAWFGPVGVAALYYALLVEERTGDPAAWHAASLVIAVSVLAHGVTSGPGLAAYRRAARAR